MRSGTCEYCGADVIIAATSGNPAAVFDPDPEQRGGRWHPSAVTGIMHRLSRDLSPVGYRPHFCDGA